MSRRNKPGCLGSLVELVLGLLAISVPVIAITYVSKWLRVSVWAAIVLIFLAPVLLYLFVRLVQLLLRRLAQKLDGRADSGDSGTLVQKLDRKNRFRRLRHPGRTPGI